MKKLLLISAITLLSVVMASAQDAKAILEKYVEKTGVAAFNETKAGRSSLLEMEMSMMGMDIPLKVIAKYPDFARIEMAVQGTNMLLILRDTVVYLTVQGQTQTITDPAQVAQYEQMRDMVGQMGIDISDLIDIKYIGKEGKGKNECDVIGATAKKNGSVNKIYVNIETGLVDKVFTEAKVEGKEVKATSVFKDYENFDEGALLIPTVMSVKTAAGTIVFRITELETDFPVATWMFAAPKK